MLTVGVIVLLVVSWSVCSDQDLSGLGRLVSTSVGNRHGEEPWLLAEHNWSLGEMQSIPGFSPRGYPRENLQLNISLTTIPMLFPPEFFHPCSAEKAFGFSKNR